MKEESLSDSAILFRFTDRPKYVLPANTIRYNS